MSDTYQIDENSFQPIDGERLRNSEQVSHKPKVLLLYGSLRERSFSRLMTEEAALVLSKLGGLKQKHLIQLDCRYRMMLNQHILKLPSFEI